MDRENGRDIGILQTHDILSSPCTLIGKPHGNYDPI